MYRNKKGFTLVEVLVVILVSTLLLALVGGTMYFISNSTERFVQQSEDIDLTKNIEKYFRSLKEDMNSINDWNDAILFQNGGNILNGDEIIFSDTTLTDFYITVDEGGFVKCYMTYQSGMKFEFIIDVIK